MSTGTSFRKTFVVLGVPAPTFTLEKLNNNSGTYNTFTDARVVLDNTGLLISDLQLSDSGEYRITTNNSGGISYREFTISVTGEYRVQVSCFCTDTF